MSDVSSLASTDMLSMGKPRSYSWLILKKFSRHRLAALGLIVISVLVASAILVDVISPYDPLRINMRLRLQPPSLAHPFGTDDLGRDQLARSMLGGRVSLSVGMLAMAVSLIVGVSIGSIAGYFGGIIDNLLMRFTDIMFMFPPIVMAMIFVTIVGQTLTALAFVIGIVSWMGLARLVRASFLSLKEEEYVLAARAIGVGNARIMLRHILPNALGTIIVAATLGITRAILLESGLSYLGLGIQVPLPSWGSMLYLAQGQLTTATWLSIVPGLLIFASVLSINFVGDGLRDAFDPRTTL